jgi:hypothetical protein
LKLALYLVFVEVCKLPGRGIALIIYLIVVEQDGGHRLPFSALTGHIFPIPHASIIINANTE